MRKRYSVGQCTGRSWFYTSASRSNVVQRLAERSSAHDRSQLHAPPQQKTFEISDSPTFGCRTAIKRSNSASAVCENTTRCDPQRGAARLVTERGWMHARASAHLYAPIHADMRPRRAPGRRELAQAREIVGVKATSATHGSRTGNVGATSRFLCPNN
jgi:hypothetical protein